MDSLQDCTRAYLEASGCRCRQEEEGGRLYTFAARGEHGVYPVLVYARAPFLICIASFRQTVPDARRLEAAEYLHRINYGLLLGNTATVTYRGKLGEATPALKVVTDPAYVTAIGRWVEPNPIDPEQEQGIEIRINGVAASINMLTLRYEAWELAPEGDRIILSGVSEGSGGPYPFEQTAEIIEMDGKPALKIDAVVLTKKDLI